MPSVTCTRQIAALALAAAGDLTDDGLAVAVVIGRCTCPCCGGEKPVLTPAEILIAARRLAGARSHLAAVAGIVHPEDLWQLCRDELTGADVRIDGWDIRGRWFGVVVGATPRTRGAATRRDDPMAGDRRPDRTARTPRLALMGGIPSCLTPGSWPAVRYGRAGSLGQVRLGIRR